VNQTQRTLALATLATLSLHAQTNTDWPINTGRPTADHYSPLTQITRANVSQLKVAWQFDTSERGAIQTAPIVIDSVLYAATPSQKIFALDAATGRELWRFDSGIKGTQPLRGVSYWSDAGKGRILAGIMDHLYQLDAATGKPIPTFGNHGSIDLRNDLDADDPTQLSVAMTSPGVIFNDLIILGFRAPETHPAPRGDIRAYDLHTGKLRWTFHTIPHPSERGAETWPHDAWKTAGAANNWAGMTLDTTHGIVYVPTGSAVDDFYGADRLGNNLYANCLLALDARTGVLLWYFQGVHHDLWDRDFPSAPVLLSVKRNGHPIDAVAQTSKQGFIFLFDRLTGQPLFPIEEKPYPHSDVPGESSSPTQPLPLKPAPYARQLLTADMLTNRTPEAHAWAAKEFSTFRSEGQFIPFNAHGQTIVLPGFDGGAEWGGPAVDPATAVLYVNANDIAWTGGLEPNKPTSSPGASIYQSQCAVCHGTTRAGSPPTFPSLIDINKRLSDADITAIIRDGKGRMPPSPTVKDERLKALLEYLHTSASDLQQQAAQQRTTNSSPIKELQASQPNELSYRFTGYRRFVDSDGYPAIAPPWGTLNAIDLNTGEYLWKIPFGEYPELAAHGMPNTGTENYGGPIITASGVLFIGATIFDRKIHAYDARTGKLLWQYELPYAALATPATYMVKGRQYVVIASAGGKDPNHPLGGLYIAFALPTKP
jgi:quinoprotein glucose dehydrogenase